MIEVHHDPEKAACDGPQSPYPDQFARLMDELRIIDRRWADDCRSRTYLVHVADEIKEYRTPRSFRIAGVALGIAFAIFLSLKLVFDPSPNVIANRAVGAVIAGCIALALYSMRPFFSPQAYSVFVSPDGIRTGTSRRWIMWSDIKALRENVLFGRIELIDHEHRRLGSIQHRIEEFHRVLEIVRQGMHRYAMTAPPQRHFGNRARAIVPIAVFVAGVCGVYAYLYFTDAEHPW